MSAIQSAVNFIRCCIEHEPDEVLAEIDSEEAISQVEGYQKSFGNDLPKLLNDPYWMKVCWNRAIRTELDHRSKADKTTKEREGNTMKTTKKPALYIVSYGEIEGGRYYGPFKSVEFFCVNTTCPKVKNDTITYLVTKMDDEIDHVTVNMVHSIQAGA